ncbi:hypothetical protein MRB53_020564 [Persea americana]|uniref:Uncharacterized protein n=1 Tax=Persea americana TaxID=3435 RepID=A0ACC2L2E8_PERAE|nr:hypothetical protein MRB53_020564 [Persea americana]
MVLDRLASPLLRAHARTREARVFVGDTGSSWIVQSPIILVMYRRQGRENDLSRQLLSLPPFPATPCLLHVKKTAAYEWLPSARSLTTSLTSPAPSSSSRATSTRTPVRGIKTSKRPVAVVV